MGHHVTKISWIGLEVTMKTATFEVKARVVAQDGTILAIFDSVEAAQNWLARYGTQYTIEGAHAKRRVEGAP